MAKYHVGKSGPAPCRASKRPCPLGGEDVHFSDKNKAQEAYEKQLSDEHGNLPSTSVKDEGGWKTRDEVRAELDVSLILFKYLEESGRLKFHGPNNDLVLQRDLDAFKAQDYKNGFTPGKHSYKDVVVASAQMPPPEDGSFPESVSLLVPNVKRLTDKKKVEIGRQVWEFSGRDVKTFDDAPEKEQLRWSNQHMGRYGDTEVEVKHGDVSWITETTMRDRQIDYVKLVTE